MFGEFNNFIIHCILSAVENVNFGDFCQYFPITITAINGVLKSLDNFSCSKCP